MHFALLGNHPDGLQMALALVETGRNVLAAYSGPSLPWDSIGLTPVRIIGDVEEILADPTIDAVIVAGDLAQRPAQLRRALQSERHVLCVYPPGDSPDIAYEAAMMQSDTGRVLLPILTGALHPAFQRIRDLLRTSQPAPAAVRLIEWERSCTGESEIPNSKSETRDPKSQTPEAAYFPGWDVLEALGGPIVEVSAFAEQTVRGPDEPLLVAGRFESGGIFNAVSLPHAQEQVWRMRLFASSIQAELELSISEKAQLTWTDQAGERHHQEWATGTGFPEMVRVFENAVQRYKQATSGEGSPAGESTPIDLVTWQDAIRAAELDDAARRSVERRRASTLDYPEATEEAGFKGTMTLIGCGMLWILLVLLVLSRWFPILLVVIVIMLTVFLCLQVLRAIVKK
jgi:predicted dehydrogenase